MSIYYGDPYKPADVIIVETGFTEGWDIKQKRDKQGRFQSGYTIKNKIRPVYQTQEVKRNFEKVEKFGINTKEMYRAFRFVDKPNLYTLGGLFNTQFGFGLSIASTAIDSMGSIHNMSADIQGALTGETMRSQNYKNTFNLVTGTITNPLGTISQFVSRRLDVARANMALERNQELTGQVINSKQHGKY